MNFNDAFGRKGKAIRDLMYRYSGPRLEYLLEWLSMHLVMQIIKIKMTNLISVDTIILLFKIHYLKNLDSLPSSKSATKV